MASSRGYLDYVLEQCAALGGVTCRPMMGEYVLYYAGKVIGGVYDDRLLLKSTPSALRTLAQAGATPEFDIPYPGAKEMLTADVDDGALLCRLIRAVSDDLPARKRK